MFIRTTRSSGNIIRNTTNNVTRWSTKSYSTSNTLRMAEAVPTSSSTTTPSTAVINPLKNTKTVKQTTTQKIRKIGTKKTAKSVSGSAKTAKTNGKKAKSVKKRAKTSTPKVKTLTIAQQYKLVQEQEKAARKAMASQTQSVQSQSEKSSPLIPTEVSNPDNIVTRKSVSAAKKTPKAPKKNPSTPKAPKNPKNEKTPTKEETPSDPKPTTPKPGVNNNNGKSDDKLFPDFSRKTPDDSLLDKDDKWMLIKKTSDPWDAIIVGGGHNGLIAGAYLAKNNQRVLVLERRHKVGGAAITEELVPGFKFSRASYLAGLMRPHIIEELNLKQHGLHFYPRSPSSFTPLADGRHMFMSPDMKFTQREIAKFSKLDAEAYPRFESFLSRCSSFFERFIDEEPPDSVIMNGNSPASSHMVDKMQQLNAFSKLALRTLGLRGDLSDFIELMTAPASSILKRWFESEPLRSTLATDSIIGAMVSPSTPGSGYVLFHHVMGITEGERGVWSYVRGGMGAVSEAIASSARHFGATIQTNVEVEEIELDHDGNAIGVRLHDGTLLRSKRVLSNATPEVTFNKLVSHRAQPSKFIQRISNLDYKSATMKINCAVDRLPNFLSHPNKDDHIAGPQHIGTIHIGEHLDQIEQSYHEAAGGVPSERPIIEMTIPSSLDPTISPDGKHVVMLFVQYTPYDLKEGTWDDAGRKQEYARRVFKQIDEYAPGFSDSVIAADVLSPLDLERTFGLTGGNIFHSSIGLDQLFWLRPAPGYTNYRTPVNNLYLCGSGAHPGGGVMGASGANAAKRVLKDIYELKVQEVTRKKGFISGMRMRLNEPKWK